MRRGFQVIGLLEVRKLEEVTSHFRHKENYAAKYEQEDADRLQRMSNRGDTIRVHLQMEAHTEADVPSANVVPFT